MIILVIVHNFDKKRANCGKQTNKGLEHTTDECYPDRADRLTVKYTSQKNTGDRITSNLSPVMSK